MDNQVSFDEQRPLLEEQEEQPESPTSEPVDLPPERVSSPEPPPYTETLEVKPTTPAQSTRYDKKGLP